MSTVMHDADNPNEDDLTLEHGGREGFEEDLDTSTADEDRERAVRMGWAPLEEFRGGEDRWIDYDEFLRRGEETLPILKERLRKTDKHVQELQSDLHDVVKNQGKFERDTRDRIQGELDGRAREAVEQGDVAAYDQVQKEIKDLDTPPPAAADPGTGKPAGGSDPAYDAWHAKNEWYGTDEDRTAFAETAAAPFVKRTRPELIGTAHFYAEVEKLVRKQYPKSFQNPNRGRPADVAGAGLPGQQGGKKTYADLPANAKAACDRFVARKDTTQEAYVADFFNEE